MNPERHETNNMNIARQSLTESDLHGYVAEASSLRLRPGQWPTTLCIAGVGNEQPFALVEVARDDEGAVVEARYRQTLGIVTLTVFND